MLTDKIIISIVVAIIFWVVSYMTMKNDFKKNIGFFMLSRKKLDQPEKILSMIFSLITIGAGIAAYFIF
ncbi:MAG: hypothetical protein C0601_13095 [Candidatus Muiribacterium halophilum]|uniref:Uncharacterized protein n=1 Tax=Muiribacterium halophilum TaxID=2053465 RepID=A0A2N5Z9N9_MUIH1|nr:MAG: hypothetical protein C0601_13095 [Candidatus Muirbacterium halophilum]